MGARDTGSPPGEVGAKYLEAVMGEGVRAAADAVALLPGGFPAALALKASSGILATAAGRVHLFLNEVRARRVEQVIEEVREQLEDEGRSEQFEELADLLIEVGPICADAETEEKRRIVRDLLLNFSRRSGEPMARTEALCALRIIGQMSAEAIVAFGIMASICGTDGVLTIDRQIGIPSEGQFHGIPVPVFRLGLRQLMNPELGPLASSTYPETLIMARLDHAGIWLCRWVMATPEEPSP